MPVDYYFFTSSKIIQQVDYVNHIVKNAWNVGDSRETAEKQPRNRRETPRNIKQYQTNRKLGQMLEKIQQGGLTI